MSHTTTCPKCGKCYDEVSEEEANSPERICLQCRNAQLRAENERLRKIAAHVPAMVYLTAKRDAGYGEAVRLWSTAAFAEAQAAEAARALTMPDEASALKFMFSAYCRLIDLGFRPAIYCPKDGTTFDAIEAGSTGIGTCHYHGDWPAGHWWMHDNGDLLPSRPILWRAKGEKKNG